MHRADGHRTIAAYLRATCNSSTATAKRDHRLAKLVAVHPDVARALDAGQLSLDHAHEIARIHANSRISKLLQPILDPLLTMGEHLSLGEFRLQVGTLIGLLDQDGSYREERRNASNRRAWMDDTSGSLCLRASGGDALTSAQVLAVFESFVHAELQIDIADRRAEHGDDADHHPLPRTQSQRNYDALVKVFAAAAGSPEASALPDPTVNIVIDDATFHESLTQAGLLLPSGNQIELDDDGNIAEQNASMATLAEQLSEDPDTIGERICHLSTGAVVDPTVMLRALLTGHVRRVVIDSRNVVTELGTRRRVFTGAAREAVLLLSRHCTHAGCTVRARHSQIDHMLEWADGGTTSQANAQPRCGPHNRFKSRERWRSKRDERGRIYNLRPDDTIVLPVGERPPDLTEEEMAERTHERVRALIEGRGPAVRPPTTH